MLQILDRHAPWLALALVLLGSARIAATYHVFSNTADEPVHVTSGVEWLQYGTSRWQTEQPPLARIFAAIGPYWLGARTYTPPVKDLVAQSKEGLKILEQGGDDRYLIAARAGILPFFWLAAWVVYAWAARDFGRPTAVLSVFAFTFIPSILAHSGLATTDMALAASLGLVFLTARRWFDRPTLLSTVALGAALGFSILCKFSVLAYLPAACCLTLVIAAILHRDSLALKVHALIRATPLLLAAALIAALIVWAGFRFSYGIPDALSVEVPMPEFFDGLKDVRDHNLHGHLAYLLGDRSQMGFWDFFPIAIAVKTPLALLVLAFWGAVLAIKRLRTSLLWIPLAFSLAILAVGMTSHINIGIRHILPIYIGISILAGAALANRPIRSIPAVLAVWLAVSSLASHPDYLAYFNAIAGDHPENILVDSDLDWGQDLKRLAARLHELHADHVTIQTDFPAELQAAYGFPSVDLDYAAGPKPGWNAIGFSEWKLNDIAWPGRFPPAERVGRSILLYNFRPGDPALAPDPALQQVLRDLQKR